MRTPEEWPWGGYRTYAYGEKNHLIDIHPYFLGQSRTKDIEECRAWYRKFVADAIATTRRAPRMSEGRFLGSADFIKEQEERGKHRRRRRRS